MKNLNSILSVLISLVLAVGPAHVSAEIPKNETPVEAASDKFGNKIEGVEVVEVKPEEAAKEGVHAAALKITFKRAEQSLREVYQIRKNPKTSTPTQNAREEVIVKFARTALADLEKYSPENMWNKRFIEHIQSNAQYEAIKKNNGIRNVSIRFPAEIVMFYGVIAMNACMFSGIHLMTSGARTNLTCLDTFTNSFKDPISTLSFMSFVGGSAATQLGGNRLLKLIDGSVLGLRGAALTKQFDNVVKEKVANSALARMESTAAHLVNPALSNIPKLGRVLGPVGMAMGMLTSRIFEESLRDENIQMCSKGIYLNAMKKDPSEKDVNLPIEYMKHCQTAFDSWFKTTRWQHYAIDMVGLVTASFTAHGLMSGITYGLKTMTNGVAQAIVKGLTFQFNFGPKNLKSAEPQWEFLNTAIGPFAPSSIVNLAGFMAVDHSFISKITSGVKISDQKQKLHFTKYKDIDPEVKRLTDSYAVEKYPADKDFDRVFRDYSSDLSVLRQMKMGAVGEAVTNWMNKTNEFLGVYQTAHQFYRDFFFTDARSRAAKTTELNPFDTRDYLRNVLSWINRGQFADGPIGLVVDSVDQPLSAGAKQFPISVILKGVGYTGNEIENFPLLSKIETVSRVANEMLGAMIDELSASSAGGRSKKEQSEVVRLLMNLQMSADAKTSAEIAAALQPKLNLEQKEILKIHLGLRAGNYKLLPEQVLTSKEMAELRLEENYRVKSFGRGDDRLVKFEEPTERDIIPLITRADKRSIKELDLRMKRVEEAIKTLATAAEKFQNSQILKSAKLNVGEPTVAAPAGTKFLSQLMTDTDRFKPDLFMHFPKSLRYVHSLRPVDYLMVSLACGPSSDLLKPVPDDLSLGELLKSPLVSSPIGSAFVFHPPGMTYIGDKVLRNEVCDRQQSAQSLYEKEFVVSGKKYKGFISLVRAHLKNEFQYFERDKKNNIETDTLKFDTWWNTHVKPLAAGILEKLQAEYYHIVINDIIPAIKKEEIYRLMNEDTDFNVSLMRKLVEARVEFAKKNARSSKKEEAAQAWELVGNHNAYSLEIYNRTDAIKTKMHSIQDFLVKAADSNKIFPPASLEKPDISYLAVSNEEYLKKRQGILNDIVELGKILNIQIALDPSQEIKINGGLKFAKDGNSEAKRTIETALRNVINNINELHRYSDMVYLLTKSLSAQ